MNKKCFVISPIGEEGSDPRKRADQILKHVIAPAAEECGFDAIRADKISEPGLITSQIIQHIIEDELVIADLTGNNPNVFYELALRHALRKPLVQIVQKGEKIPFDVAGMRTISVDHKDLDSVDEAKEEIKKQILSVKDKNPDEIDSPISVTLELQMLRHSEKPEERNFGEFLTAVADLKKDILSIEKRLDSPQSILPPEYFRDITRMFNGRRNREYEMMMEEAIHRLRRVSSLRNDKEGKIDKEWLMEMDRLEEMLYRMRKEMG